ncbi:uncharacterized protein KGF55_000017 [Candida pseudojiufengensis]|uniref:uncharacterized protein n=1 Tax=Candida pseudojiufengensis TaxID=497109 RepID=UPI002224EAE8|nr:uncharacterized protein KGF55_000017 [Candida pseudojiufengensis]KAI5968170.1 hypothetical protein KGF55_000017 [Candida pseudojiufengensis]
MPSIDLRSPSFLERYQLCRVERKYYPNFNVTVKYPQFEKLNKQEISTLLSHAISKVIHNHPILGCNYFELNNSEDDFKNYTIRSIDIKFNDLVSVQQGEIDEEYFTKLNDIYFEINTSKPLWSLIICQDYLTIVCSHIFFDGNSGCFFHQDLMEELNSIKGLDNLKEKEYVSKANEITSVPPAVVDSSNLFSLPIIPTFKNLFHHYIPWFKETTKYPLFKTKPIAVNQILNNKFKIYRINIEKLTKLLDYVRSHQLTLTPFLVSIAFKILSKYYPNTAFDVTIPLNGRKYDQSLDKYQGCVAESVIALDPPFDHIETTKKISTKLTQDLKSRNPFYQVALLKLVNIDEFFKNRIGSYGRHTIEISNVGKLPFQDCYFNQGCGFGSHLQLNVVSDLNGMNIIFGCIEEIEEYFYQIVEDYEKEIDEIISNL